MGALSHQAFQLFSILSENVVGKASRKRAEAGKGNWDPTRDTPDWEFYQFFKEAVRTMHESESVMMAHTSSISSTQNTIVHTKTTEVPIDKPKEDPPSTFNFPPAGYGKREPKVNQGQGRTGRRITIKPPPGFKCEYCKVINEKQLTVYLNNCSLNRMSGIISSTRTNRRSSSRTVVASSSN